MPWGYRLRRVALRPAPAPQNEGPQGAHPAKRPYALTDYSVLSICRESCILLVMKRKNNEIERLGFWRTLGARLALCIPAFSRLHHLGARQMIRTRV